MISTGSIILNAYKLALAGIGTPVFFVAPPKQPYPYVLIDNLNELGGEDVATRTKQNRNSSSVDVVLQIVTGTGAGGGAKQAEDIAALILPIVLNPDPKVTLDFAPIKNVVPSLDSSTYIKEWNDTHLIITKEITINHLISQP